MKKLLFLFALIFVSCGDGEEILGNCVVAPDLDRVCTEEYQPVCACNGIVYGSRKRRKSYVEIYQQRCR